MNENDWHQSQCPYRFELSAKEADGIRAQRSELKGRIVIIEEGGPNVYVDCSFEEDCYDLMALSYLGLLSN